VRQKGEAKLALASNTEWEDHRRVRVAGLWIAGVASLVSACAATSAPPGRVTTVVGPEQPQTGGALDGEGGAGASGARGRGLVATMYGRFLPSAPPSAESLASIGASADLPPDPARGDGLSGLGSPSKNPVLRRHFGDRPLVFVSEGEDGFLSSPVFDLALFEDGIVAFEGKFAVKVVGLAFRRLPPEELGRMKGMLTELCGTVDPTPNPSRHVCSDCGRTQIVCRRGATTIKAADDLGGWFPAGKTVHTFAKRTVEILGASAWIGEPRERRGVGTLSAEDLWRMEIRRTIPAHM
jgi:hypothetical protein